MLHRSPLPLRPGSPSPLHFHTWWAALAGLCASLVGIGLGRFAYTPLIPALVAAGWFTPSQAVYLGAANLAGYLVGALAARRLTARWGTRSVLRGMMLVASASFFGCAAHLPFAWYFSWRLAAGAAGGSIMVLAATAILPHVAPNRRGLVGGFIFTGVGLGIAASGKLVPLLLVNGLVQTWCAIGELSGLLTALAWNGWPQDTVPSGPGSVSAVRVGRTKSLAVNTLILGYGLNAVGLVPHMIFLAVFVARGLGLGIEAGSHEWVLYGLGAMAGPLVAGRLADVLGFAAALRAAFLLQAVAVALPAFTTAPGWLAASSIVVGGFTPGIVALALGRLQELIGPDVAEQRRAWGRATISFALFQAAAAYGYSFLFARMNDAYGLIFMIASAATMLALLLDVAVSIAVRARVHPA